MSHQTNKRISALGAKDRRKTDPKLIMEIDDNNVGLSIQCWLSNTVKKIRIKKKSYVSIVRNEPTSQLKLFSTCSTLKNQF